MKKILEKILLLKNLIFFDKNEKIFLKDRIKISNKKKRINIIFQCFNDYYQILYLKKLIKENSYQNNFYGIWPHVIHPYPYYINNITFIIQQAKNIIFFTLLRRKWLRFYRTINVEEIINLEKINFLRYFSLRKEAKLIFQNIKNKKDILNIKIKKVKVGDLIYDTYLRFRCVPTPNIKDKFLFKIILKTIIMIDNLTKFLRENKIESYFTTYTSYIHHGVPARFFIENNVNVYSSVKSYMNNYINKLSKNHFKHAKKYSNFDKDFKKLKNKNSKIIFAKKELVKKFKGKYERQAINLKVNTFKQPVKNYKYLDKLDGVVFLHDFFDSSHETKFTAFEDYYEWTIFTLEFILKNKLNIGVKLHPNTKPESLYTNNIIKNRYKGIIWVNTNLSNLSIFNKKNIKFGVSVVGTVLQELCFFNKYPVFLGENPISSFNIAPQIKNKQEYKNALLHGKKYKLKKNAKEQICKLYYMYIVHQKNYFPSKIAKKINIKGIDSTSSKDFIEYNKKINKDT